jgi:DNA invertase Pin-like site-specific DNA recombinase
METIIYIRTSTEEQEPENQIKSCQKLSKGEYELLQDKQSAFTDKKDREKFELAKKLIKSGKIKHFIVWDLDRIYRNRIKLKEFFQFCKIHKCNIHSVNQQWLEQLNNIPEPFNEIMHDLMLNLMGWLAEDESKKKSERVRLAVRKQKGITKSYKGNKWGRKPLGKKSVEEILRLYKEGKSMREISEEVFYWDKNNNKKQISKSAVHKIINENKDKKFSI